METERGFLAGDVYSLKKVNKIVPRKMELPLLIQSRIQIRKNLFGIKTRFFEHMKSYDYKFKSLAAEPKQVIRALRSKSSCLPRSVKSRVPSISERSMIEKSSSWKLPPNVYRLKDHFEDVSKKQMGKLGPYQCFTVERDVCTVKNHHAPKPFKDICELFYDVPAGMDEMMLISRNRYKSRFLKSQRFEDRLRHDNPPPTKYYPQNFVIKPKPGKRNLVTKNPLMYYPHTTVPIRELAYLKGSFSNPPPGRYDPHDVTCKCNQNGNQKRCPGSVQGDGHRHVFRSKVHRLERPVKIEKRIFVNGNPNINGSVHSECPTRNLISFRLKRSQSCDDLLQVRRSEIRFNTMVKKKNFFSLKTGRPVGFLTAAPRFRTSSEVSIKLDSKKSVVFRNKEQEKPRRKAITKERLDELAAPKNPLPKIISQKANILEPLPFPSSKKVAKKLSIIESPSAMSEAALKTKQNEEDEASMKDSQLFVTGTQSAK